MRHRWFTFPALIVLVLGSGIAVGAKCYEPDTRVVVFIQGIYSTLDEEGTQTSYAETDRFDALKASFIARGYTSSDLLDYSFNGGQIARDGGWHPEDYDCEDTDRPLEGSVDVLEEMLRDYREAHPGVHFTLVGHSLGGSIAFLAGARDAERLQEVRLDIDVVVTLDAPLLGVSADKKIITDLVACEKTYAAGAELVAARADATTLARRARQAAAMAEAGIRLGTFGNTNDCFYYPALCAGGTWADDRLTQFLPGHAAVSMPYAVQSAILESHDAILTHPAALAEVVTFVGAP